jgi:hypothetical protein
MMRGNEMSHCQVTGRSEERAIKAVFPDYSSIVHCPDVVLIKKGFTEDSETVVTVVGGVD